MASSAASRPQPLASRPPPPPKPSHLSVALTGTVNSDAFSNYIKAQSTGGSFSSLPSRRDDDEDDDSEQWATARPQHTPIKTTTLDHLFGEDAEAEHDRSQSSISTIKGKSKLTAEYLKSLEAGGEDDDEDADALLAGALHHARLETDASVATIKPEAASKQSVGAGVRPESSSTMGMSTYVPSALVPIDTGMSTYGPPHWSERSRAPSILSAGGDMRFSQWDMQGGAAPAPANQSIDDYGAGSTSTTVDVPATLQAAKPAAVESSLEKPAAKEPPSSQASSSAARATDFQPAAHSEPPATLSSLLSRGRPARALFAINGEAAFNELSLSAGQTFQVISDDLQGGWSLAVVSDNTASEGWRRGLVPNGWYAFEREMLPPRPVEEVQTSTVQAGGQVEEQQESHSGYIAAPTTAASRFLAVGQLHSPPILEQDLAPGTSLHPADASKASLPRPSGPSRATQALSQLVIASPEHLRARSFDGRSDEGSVRAASMRRGPSNASIAVPETVHSNSDGSNAVADEQRASTSTLSPPRPTPFVQPFSRAFNRFSPFVSSGAEAYLLSPDPIVNYAPHRPRRHQKKDSSNDSSPLPNAAVLHLRDTSATTLASQDEDGEDGSASTDSARYEVESGPSGDLRWRDQLPRFWVEVHDAHYVQPRKRRTGWLLGAPEGYVLYQVTTRFVGEGDEQDTDAAGMAPPLDPSHPSSEPLQSLTVSRRFQHFVWLATHLSTSYPLIPLPPLPAKSRSRRFDRNFVEERRKVLATFLERVARHPVLRQDDAVTSFLTGGAAEAEDEEQEGRIAATVGESIQEWEEWVIEEEGRQQYRQASATASHSAADGGHHLLAPGADFFARSLHKEFAIDAEDVESEWKAAERWNGLIEEAVSGSQQDAVLETMRRFREDAVQAAEGYKALGRSLLKLTTTGGDGGNSKVTQRHSWCWRPHCPSCSILTSCMQETADALQDVGALQDQQARDALFALHERLWSISRPHAVNADLWEVGKETLSRYELARNADAAAGLTQLQQHQHQQQKTRTAAPAAKLPVETAELLASKAETVLNVCMAELDRVHEDKVEDWAKVGRDVLDGQIAFHRAALERLEAARDGWTDKSWREKGARQAAGIVDERSPYLAQLGVARVAPPAPLPQPSAQLLQPGVLERGILRPVGLAGDYFLSVMGLGTSAEGFNEEARPR